MTALDSLKASRIWNAEWGLPLVPSQNPHQYLAYTRLVLRLRGESVDLDAYRKFFHACEVKPGIFKRWPDSGDDTSHDEAFGAAFMDHEIAGRIRRALDLRLGTMNVHGKWNFWRFNVYRIPWLRGALVAAEDREPSWLDQWIWCKKIELGAKRESDGSKCGPKPRLQNWLAASKMRRFPRCMKAWDEYRWRIQQGGNTLRNDLLQEPGVQELADLAPLTYDHPKE